MKANELMFGDWVHNETLLFGVPYGEDIQVINVYDGLINYAVDELGLITGYRLNECHPIPLTAEILEKNGFERGGIFPSKFYRNIDNEQIMFCPYSGCYDMEYVHWNESNEVDVTHHLDVQQPMAYVHELQRALRCCGLWTLADNFKI